jgi:hypothetical protein
MLQLYQPACRVLTVLSPSVLPNVRCPHFGPRTLTGRAKYENPNAMHLLCGPLTISLCGILAGLLPFPPAILTAQDVPAARGGD